MSFFSRLFGHSETKTMTPSAFVAQRDSEAPVLDVRTPQEFAQGHLAGATNADVTGRSFQSDVEALNLSQDAPVYLYCRSGNRSGKATSILRKMGYSKAVNVGGFDALRRAGAQTVPPTKSRP
ncbi:MAG: rhodanese-like domain-containing protein [Bacteroidota bacterium]